MSQLALMDSWHNAHDAGFIRLASQFILPTTFNIINLSWLKVDEQHCTILLLSYSVHAVLGGLGIQLTKCSPTFNGFWQNQQEAVVNACRVPMIECT